MRYNQTNHRSILFLSCFAKIFEKLLFKRLNVFIRKQSIIAPTQCGFRPGLSTLYAVTHSLTLFHNNINDKKYCGLVFLDVQKAFGAVDHKILIAKLER